ncbi:MAG TPA: nucleotide pyrophosphohydrolase [Patescibacteria group bacterium]|jgi:NTP pyrophosphatase (non-canonical NTP hydrolase)|nr:nucleotide pyrophosphohydrolase [Patescibacteria group bacterium]
MSDIKKLTRKIMKFRDDRDWKKFHNPKDVALSLVLEATEVLEKFQWKNQKETEEYIRTNKADIGEELADVLYWILLMSYDLDININRALENKIKKNERHYPVDKAKGKHVKYTELKI